MRITRLFTIVALIGLMLFFGVREAQAENWRNHSTVGFFDVSQNCGDENADDPVCKEGFDRATYVNFIHATSGSLIPLECAPDFTYDCLNEYGSNAAVPFIGNSIASLYDTPPASSVYYAYDLLHNAGFIESAHAQGIGYSGLSPILPIWKAFRNIAYVILVVVMLAVGFMIMFRMRIDAQTAVGIQTALPGIIITLILITFSYAIAGLLIDLMYFLIFFIVAVFAQSGILLDAYRESALSTTWETAEIPAAVAQEYYLNANLGTLFSSIMSWDMINALPVALFRQDWIGSVGLGDVLIGGGALSLAAIFTPVGVMGALIVGAIGAIPTLLIALALLFTVVRLFMMLLNSYIQVIIAVIFAPLQLLMGAIPGRNAFRNWIMGLIGNLIVFPVAALLFIIGNSISALSLSGEHGSMWSPPFLVGPTAEGSGPQLISGLIGFGIIILTPGILSSVKSAFAPKPALPITPGLVFRPVQSGYQTFTNLAQTRYAMQTIGGLKGLIPGGGRRQDG